MEVNDEECVDEEEVCAQKDYELDGTRSYSHLCEPLQNIRV